MKRVFADAYYFIALLNQTDAGHDRARAFGERFDGERLTTVPVLLEFADAMAGSHRREEVARMIRKLLLSPRWKIVEVGDDLLDRGLSLFADRADKKWSLTDCLSFLTMQDEQLTDALTADHHFVQTGFNALLRK